MTETDSTPLDQAIDALSNPTRRRLLLSISEYGPHEDFSLDALATPETDHDQLTVQLYHVHLPKLADAGYVDWDGDVDTVRPGSNFEEVAPVLQLLHHHRDELPPGWP